jgi:DNA-binding MarR family transcriptional regulator
VTQNNIIYDIFISYAVEDRDTIALPLALKLKELGLKVWFDEFSLHVGDKLRVSIDKGLTGSNFGIVILSNNFFSKEWPKFELEGLVTLSLKNISRILPIWHGVNLDKVVSFSPMLASIKALPTSIGIDRIASKIHQVVTNNASQINEYDYQKTYDSFAVDEDGNMVRVSEIQSKRFRFLLELYKRRDRSTIKNNAFEIGSDLGYNKETVIEILHYLEDKGYLEFPVIGSYVEITVVGMDYVEDLIPNSEEVKNVRSIRTLFLKELYAVREQYVGLNMYELGRKLGIPEKGTEDIVFYLKSVGLVESPGLGPFIKITTYGIDSVEQRTQQIF